MPADERTEELLSRYDTVKSERKNGWDAAFDEMKKLIRPNAKDFASQPQSGNRRNNYIFDTTAPDAAEKFAATLNSSLTPANEIWLKIGLRDDPSQPRRYNDDNDRDSLLWRERVGDIILGQYSLPESNHAQAVHEWYLDLGVFCTANLLQEFDPVERHLVFRSIPLAQTYILENHNGLVDTVFCDYEFTKRQAVQRFGMAALPKEIRECKDSQKKFKFAHCVFPRADEDRSRWGNGKGMPFASIWLCVDAKAIASEGGYISLPYHVIRWEKVAGETYGRGPGHTAMPAIKEANERRKVGMMAEQLAVLPPMQIPSDSFMSAIDFSPGALNYREPGTEEAKPIVTGARPDVNKMSMEELKEAISSAFYTDLSELRWKNERQSATEIIERSQDRLRRQLPMLGRVQAEGISLKVRRSYELLARYAMLPMFPASLHKRKLYVNYISPAAIAQRGSKVNAMNDFINSKLLPLAQLDPTVVDIIDVDATAQESAQLLNVTPKIIRSPEEIQARRQERAKQQQTANMLSGAQQGAAALKDIAAAGKDTPELLGLPR